MSNEVEAIQEKSDMEKLAIAMLQLQDDLETIAYYVHDCLERVETIEKQQKAIKHSVMELQEQYANVNGEDKEYRQYIQNLISDDTLERENRLKEEILINLSHTKEKKSNQLFFAIIFILLFICIVVLLFKR